MKTQPISPASADPSQSDDAIFFDFDISLRTNRPFIQRDRFAFLSFSLRHFHTKPISISCEPRTDLQLGYRLLSPKSNAIVFEDRIRIDAEIVPEVPTPLVLPIPAHYVAAGSQYNILVDFLVERRYWFHQRGVAPFQQVVEFNSSAANLIETARFGKDNQRDGVLKLSYGDDSFGDFLDHYDFSAYSVFDVLLTEKSPTRALPAALLSILNGCFREPSQIDQACALTELMAHFGSRHSPHFEKLSGTRAGRFQLVRDFAAFARDLSGRTSDYFPQPLLDFLNASAFDDGVFKVPMSRLMLWCWLDENRVLRHDMMREREEIYWWWITAAMPSRGLPAAMIPAQALSYFCYPHDSFGNRAVTLSRFAYRAYQTSDTLQQKYDLSNDIDLIAYSFDFLLHNYDNSINNLFIGNGFRDFWSVTDNSTGMTRFETAVVTNYLKKSGSADDALRSDSLNLLRSSVEVNDISLTDFVLANKRSASKREDDEEDIGSPRIVIAGLSGSRSGLGVNMSMSAATFRHMDRAADEYDVASRSFGREFGSKPFDAALFHVNADAVCDAILYDKSCRLSNAYRIGFYLWELDKLPRTHRLGCMVVDEIWTPSEFLRELYSQCTDKKVTNVKKYVMLSNVAALTRATDKSRFKFLTSFDFHSGVERKNPIALVRAFQRAFPRHRTDVQLTIKTTEFVPDHWGDANGQWLLVKQASAADPRISVIETALSEQEYFCLISNHDCVVSAHRAEGFGYLPAYAMSLGVPVIVTDYSGTRDFCSTETSFPVSFKLIEVRPGEFIADVPGARWADIDIDDLAATLRIVREGGSDVEDRAKRGQQLMRAEYSLDAHARRYKQLLTDRGLLAAL